MTTKSFSFNISILGSNNVQIASGGSALIIFSTSNVLSPSDFLLNATLTIGLVQTPSSIQNIKLINSFGNDQTVIDYPTVGGPISSRYLIFDITRFLSSSASNSFTLSIKNDSPSTITLKKSGTDNRVFGDYIPAASLPNKNSVFSFSQNDYDGKFNFLTNELSIQKTLIKKALLYDISINFSNLRANSSYSFFPKGWTLNLLEHLEFNNGIPIQYVDKNNRPHNLIQVVGESDYFYTEDGSGLILEINEDENTQIITYKLFNELLSQYKIFDSTGRIINAKLDNIAGGRFLTFNYSSNLIEITDSNGNEIDISYDSDNSIISFSLNNTLLYTFAKDSSNRLSSINKGNLSDTFSYPQLLDIGDYNIVLSDTHKIVCSFLGSKYTSISIMYGTNTIESYNFEYDYLKTYVTDRHGVTTYYCFDDKFELISSGEVDEDEDESFIYCHQKNMLVRELALSLKYSKARQYKTSNSEESVDINTSSNNLETITLYSSTDFKIKKGHTYVLIAKLEKNSDVVLRANRSINLVLNEVGTSNTISSIVFNPYYTSQYACASFKAYFSEGNSYSEINISAQNLYTFGGATISNVYLIEVEKKVETYFVRKEDGDNLDITGLIGPIAVDGYDWYEITTSYDGFDQNNNPINRHYSYQDLVRNYINAERGESFFWDEDNTHLTFSDTYSFRRRIIHAPANSVFAKKIIKNSYTENNVDKEVYTFDYLYSETDSNTNEKVFIHKTITHYDNEDYESYKKYSLDLKLLEEYSDSPELYKKYSYDNSERLVTIFASKEPTGYPAIIDHISYDSLSRISSLSSFYSGVSSLETKLFEYLDDTKNVSIVTDENGVDTEYEYDSYLDKNIEITSESISITKTYDESSLLAIANETTFNFGVDSYGFHNSFSVANEFSIEKEVELDIEDEITEVDIITKYNKYGYIQTIYEQVSHYIDEKVIFIYSDKAHNDIRFITSQSSCSFDSASKLYKVINNYNILLPDICFAYDSSGRLNEIKYMYPSGAYNYNDLELTVSYSYDPLDRYATKSINFGGGKNYTESYEYIGVSNYINKTTFNTTGFLSTGNVLYEEYTRDYLNRHWDTVFKNDDGLGQNEIKHWTKCEYFSAYIGGKERTNCLIKNIDFLSSQIIYEDGNYHASYTYDYSHFMTYTHNGMIASIKRGTYGTPSNNTGAEYAYDDYNQLISETNYDLGIIINYSYDLNGNILSATKINLTNNQTISTDTYQYSNNYKDKLTKFNGNDIYYDANMNIIEISNNNDYECYFGWERNKYLLYVENNGVFVFNYFNHEGIRNGKDDGNRRKHRYILDGHRILGETIKDGLDTTYIAYLYGQTGITGMIYNSHIYYFRKNVLGDIIAIFDGNNLVAKYVYDAYGNHVVLDANDNEITNLAHIGHINPFRYRGYYFDEDVKLYYCNARFYSPLIRRWLSMDSIENLDPDSLFGINLYSYCNNNPIAFFDPDGTFGFLASILIGAAIGAIIGTTFGIIEVVNEGRTGWNAVRHILIKMFTGAFAGTLVGIGAGFGSMFVSLPFSGIGAFSDSLLGGIFCDLNDFGYVKDFSHLITDALISSALACVFSITFSYIPIKAISNLELIIKNIAEEFVEEIFDEKIKLMELKHES